MSFELIINKIKNDDKNNGQLYLDNQILPDNEKLHKNLKVCKYNQLSSEERLNIHSNINILYEDIINDLAHQLNSIHNTKYSVNFWKIVVGPWLDNFLCISYNRFNKIKKAFKENQISSVNIFECDNEDFVPIDNLELTHLCNNSNWNAVIYSKIISFLKPNISIRKSKIIINIKREKNFNYKYNLKNILSKILSFFFRDNDSVLVNTYLPFFENIKLYLYLKQFPQIWDNKKIYKKKFDIKKREKILFEKKKDNFENFVKNNIPFSIPTCHIESFNDLNHTINSSNLPKNPKFIFSSNNYEYDEIFKLYAALRFEKNSVYIIGQHGNISWIENVFFEKNHAANHYLYWGKNGFGKDEDGFNFKIIN